MSKKKPDRTMGPPEGAPLGAPEGAPLGALVFTRDPSRRGRVRRVDTGVTLDEALAEAKRLDAPKELIPEVPSDRKILAKLLSRLGATGSKRGVSIKQTKKSRSRVVVEIYERPRGGGKAMDLVGELVWNAASPESIEGADHPVVNELRDEYRAQRGRLGPGDWMDQLRLLLLEKWRALSARHEGRVYWVPDVYVDQVARYGELTETLEQFSVVVVPLIESMRPFVTVVLLDYLSGELDSLKGEVELFTGREDIAKYKRINNSLEQLRVASQWYQDHSGALNGPEAQAFVDGALALQRVVQRDYMLAAEQASIAAGGTKSPTGKKARKSYLDLPEDAPPPPEPPLVELAPLPQSYLSIGGVVFRREEGLDSGDVRAYVADHAPETGELPLAKWIQVGDGHVFVAMEGGPPRIYLTVQLGSELRVPLSALGIEVHV